MFEGDGLRRRGTMAVYTGEFRGADGALFDFTEKSEPGTIWMGLRARQEVEYEH
jgi:hypothetical protein